MSFKCKVCNYQPGCWCGGRKCKCGFTQGKAQIASTVYQKYPDVDKNKLIEVINKGLSWKKIYEELGITPTEEVAATYTGGTAVKVYDEKFARDLGMSNPLCHYTSLEDSAKCTFCGRPRKYGHLKPCPYYLAKYEEKKKKE